MVLDTIPFTPSFEEYGTKIKIEKYASMEKTVRTLFDHAAPRIRPKAVFKETFIEKEGEDRVLLENQEFTSAVLRRNLDPVERVFPYVATCGNELEDFPTDPADFMEQFLLDALKEMALRTALAYLRNLILETYKIPKMASMNPGSGDYHVWPIEQQVQLFRLLGDVHAAIGVYLTDSHLMVPNKTVSGIYFPTEVDFEMCQECRRELCPNRRGEYRSIS